ncbi:MAG TPA: Hpt domain-containing protein [Caulobacteraceae bacterium]|nr:Hpt domain-containing protein [Caulobacteraceae bacterium]
MAKRDLSGAVDFGHLETFAAGDQALVEEVLGLFRQQTAMWLPLLDPAMPADAWRDAAHSLKGSALGVGAFAVAQACEAAELAFEQPLGVKEARLNAVRDAIDRALSDIAAYIHEQTLQSLKTPSMSLGARQGL